jgi:hypothetical protein
VFVGASCGGGTQVYTVISRIGFTSTALTQNTYTTVASPSVALGTSSGSVGAWHVTVKFAAGTNESAPASPGSACIVGTNAGTGGGGSSTKTGSAPCPTNIANALAGSALTADAANTIFYFPAAFYEAQYANGTTVSFTCQLRVPDAAITASGACTVVAEPI